MPSSDIDRPTSYVRALVPRQIALLQVKVLINNHLNYFGVLVCEVLVFEVLVFEAVGLRFWGLSFPNTQFPPA